MYVLGLNALSHDVAATLVDSDGGRVVAAVEEERLSRVKHHPGIPLGGTGPELATAWCLREAGISMEEVGLVAHSWCRRPVAELLERPGHFLARPGMVARYLWGMARRRRPPCREAWLPHHLSHAASAWRLSGIPSAGVLVVDGSGEREATSLFEGRGGELELVAAEPKENSLGLLYRTVSEGLGMGWWGEGKTMGLAPYGRVREEYAGILRVGERGYRVDLALARRLVEGLADPATPSQKAKDVAATLQHLLDEAMVGLVGRLRESVGSRDLCLAGGVALNCTSNRAVLRECDVGRLFVQPAAHDAGGALGAALEAAWGEAGTRFGPMTSAYLGPAPDTDAAAAACRARGLSAERQGDAAGAVAELLAEGRVGAVARGRAELGPRALGNRSILADARDRAMHERVNRLKGREAWRPLAPAILAERAGDYLAEPERSPFMLLSFTIREERRAEVPAVVHVDGTARAQTVDAGSAPFLHEVLDRFGRATGVPVLLNTSFNRRGEPMVCGPPEAVEAFEAMGLDFLLLGDLLVRRG